MSERSIEMHQSKRAPWFELAAILLLAAALRAYGLDFGLPAVYNMDEVAITSRALGFATGDLNPHNFVYPTFFFYVLFGWLGASFAVTRVTGAVTSLAAFQQEFFVDPTRVYLAGRWLGVACGVASVAATWWLARRLFGRTTALVAALFLAVAPVAVRDAHYVKHDVPVTLAVVLAMIAISRVWPGAVSDLAAKAPPGSRLAAGGWRPERAHVAGFHLPGSVGDRCAGSDDVSTSLAEASTGWGAVLVAGIACGVAFSTHYYSVFLVLPLAWAMLLAARDRGWRASVTRLLVAGVAATVAFFALSPFLLVEWRTAIRDVVANRQIVVDRAADAGGTAILPSAGKYAAMLWQEGIGWPVVVCAIVGIAWLARRQWRLALWLLLFPVTFLLFISNTVAASRYLNPALPFVALFAAYAVDALAPIVASTLGRPLPARRTPTARPPWPYYVAAAVIALPGLAHSVRTGWFFSQDDTRTLAQRFIESRIPPGSTVLLQPYSVQLQQSRESLVEALTANVGGPDKASTKFALRLGLNPYPSPAYRTIYIGDGGLDADKIYVPYAAVQAPDPLRGLRAYGIDVVVWKRYVPPEANARGLLAVLDSEGERLAVFSPYKDGDTSTQDRPEPFLHNTDTPISTELARPGPVIEVWRVP